MRCLALFVLTLVLGLHSSNALRSLLRDTEVNALVPEGGADDFEVELVYPRAASKPREAPFENLKRHWGVPDTQTVVGKVFQYRIPTNAFKGPGRFYTKLVKKPSWLELSETDNILQGVPTAADLGKNYVAIQAKSTIGPASANDIFEIDVVSAHEDSHRDVSCKLHEGVSVLSVVLGSSVASISPAQRVRLLKKFSHYIRKRVSEVSLTETPAQFDPLSDNSAIRVGSGSAKLTQKSHGAYGQIQVQVGCAGKLSSAQNELVVKQIEVTAASGELQQLVKLPIVGWHLSVMEVTSGRFRRQTFEENFSGDYYDEYDNNYDDYEDYEQYFKENGPASSSTPDEVSSVDVQPNLIPTALKPVPYSTPVMIPVKPTRVIVEASPTPIPSSATTTARSSADLESSIQVYPSTTTEYTTPLAGPSSQRPQPTEPTKVIQPTAIPDFGETTEYGAKNFAPVIKKRIPKLDWVTGNVYRMKIPADAFEDPEDGGTRNLSLVLKDNDGKVLGYDSWIQLNLAYQEIYALPLEKEISRFDLQLEAIDSGRKSTVDKLKIRVTQPKEARNYNHKFSVVLKLEQKLKRDAIFALDWQVRAVEKIAQLYNSDISSINVRNISVASSIHLSWTNVTLIDSTSTVCPDEQLQQLAQMLIEEDSHPTTYAKTIFAPEFELEHARVHYYKACSHLNHKHHDHDTVNEVDDKNHMSSFENTPPLYRNQIDQLIAEEGKIFKYKVKEDSCYDREEGGVSALQMRLLTTDLLRPPTDHWLQFDEANREFYGLPLKADIGKRDYLLECKDSHGEKTDDALVVMVSPSSEESQPPVEFSLKIDADYNQFISSVDQKVALVSRIAKVFGDSTSKNVRVSRFEMGSVQVSWTNSSLSSSPCPRDRIQALSSVMTDDSGEVQESFKAAFLPAFTVISAQVTPMGHCLAGDTPTHPAMPDVGEPPSVAEEQEVISPDEDYLLTFIIPAVLIALMLLLAGLVAWCLWRRRRYAKLSLTDERTFISKGVPVIFAEELDDQRCDGANIPVIMKEEKPPLPPPEYQRHSPSGVSSTPPRTDRGSMPPDHGPYQPPHPPYASANGSNRNPRPNMPPAYRKPPTYVPP